MRKIAELYLPNNLKRYHKKIEISKFYPKYTEMITTPQPSFPVGKKPIFSTTGHLLVYRLWGKPKKLKTCIIQKYMLIDIRTTRR